MPSSTRKRKNMPEGPEVQLITEFLNEHLRGKTISDFEILNVRYRNPRQFKRLKNCAITKIYRRAKFIFFEFHGADQDYIAISHLALTGKWVIRKTALQPIHTLFSFTFDDGTVLDYIDPRKFGRFNIYSNEEFWNDEKLQKKIGSLGPDILTEQIDSKTWKERLQKYLPKKKRKRHWEIKPVLLDQKLVAGIGNIYASEICYVCGINPFRKVEELTTENIESLAVASKEILKQAYESGGSTIRDYVKPDGSKGMAQNTHYVYAQKHCRLCNSAIRKAPQKGRTTYWCPKCQDW